MLFPELFKPESNTQKSKPIIDLAIDQLLSQFHLSLWSCHSCFSSKNDVNVYKTQSNSHSAFTKVTIISSNSSSDTDLQFHETPVVRSQTWIECICLKPFLLLKLSKKLNNFKSLFYLYCPPWKAHQFTPMISAILISSITSVGRYCLSGRGGLVFSGSQWS